MEKICKICQRFFFSLSSERDEIDDEDTCPICWEHIYNCLNGFEEEEEEEEDVTSI